MNSLDCPLSLAVVMKEARREWAEYFAPICSFTSRFTRRSESRRRDGVPASPVLPRASDTNTGPLAALAQQLYPGLVGPDGAEQRIGSIKNSLLLQLAGLVSFAFGQTQDESRIGQLDVFQIQAHQLGTAEGPGEAY